jgi:RNA polymerase sigma-70 factor (ECF subfamily)
VPKSIYSEACIFFSIKDIAVELEISESTIEKHIAKGVLRCADYLNENGYDVSARSKHSTRKVDSASNKRSQ